MTQYDPCTQKLTPIPTPTPCWSNLNFRENSVSNMAVNAMDPSAT